MVWKVVGVILTTNLYYTHLKIQDCEGTQIVQPHWMWPLTEKDNLDATFSNKHLNAYLQT
jgi:hypothetical protein